jgi:hypothetical protein
MTSQTSRLVKLLPKLSAMTDQHRLKVLSDIDRLLAGEGFMWADIAEALSPPRGEGLPAADVLAIIDRIEQQERALSLTSNASAFLADVRDRAEEGGGSVYLTSKQTAWLHALHAQAER